MPKQKCEPDIFTSIFTQTRKRIKRVWRLPLTKYVKAEVWVSILTFILLFVWMILDLWVIKK